MGLFGRRRKQNAEAQTRASAPTQADDERGPDRVPVGRIRLELLPEGRGHLHRRVAQESDLAVWSAFAAISWVTHTATDIAMAYGNATAQAWVDRVAAGAGLHDLQETVAPAADMAVGTVEATISYNRAARCPEFAWTQDGVDGSDLPVRVLEMLWRDAEENGLGDVVKLALRSFAHAKFDYQVEVVARRILIPDLLVRRALDEVQQQGAAVDEFEQIGDVLGIVLEEASARAKDELTDPELSVGDRLGILQTHLMKRHPEQLAAEIEELDSDDVTASQTIQSLREQGVELPPDVATLGEVRAYLVATADTWPMLDSATILAASRDLMDSIDVQDDESE